MQFLRRIWTDVQRGENIDLYVTVTIAVGLAILNLSGIAPPTWIAPITLAALGLLAASTLGNRYRVDELNQKVTQVIDRLDGLRAIEVKVDDLSLRLKEWQVSPFRLEDDHLNLPEVARDAATVDVLAWSGVNLFRQLPGFWEDRIKAGCRVRFLIVDRNSKAADVIVENSKYGELKSDIDKVIARYREICSGLPGVAGSLELRAVPWVFPCAMVIVDAHEPGGLLWLTLSPTDLYTPEDKRRSILVDSRKTLGDYKHFVDQYDALWAKATPISVEHSEPDKGA